MYNKYDYKTTLVLPHGMSRVFKYELISYMGNISLKDGERFIHSHISFSDSKYNVFGGHLFDAKISAAGEFILFSGDKNINRYFDNDVGLFFWRCEEE